MVSPETIESIERFKSLCTELMSLIFTQKEEKEDSKTDDEIAAVHSKTCQVSNMIVTLFGLVKDELYVNRILQFFCSTPAMQANLLYFI